MGMEVILQLFNKIWLTSKIPPSWLHAIVVPIPKPNKPSHLPSSYRPISLTSNVCKLFEKMIVCRLDWFLEYHNVLHISQSGFRQRRKTTDHLLRLHDAIHKSMANKHNVLSVFIDIEKAYDMVNKEVLLSKLLSYGISGRMFRFIRSFLSNRTFQVCIGSTLSMTKRIENSTPQGSVLSPILFSLMINYLPTRITSHAALYADDFCFWECGSDITLLNQLCQRSLTKVWNWCEECGFKLSSSKSTAVLFTRKHNPAPISLLLQDGTRLPLKKEYKYLGLTFQRNGSYSTRTQNVAAKCRARLNVIRFLKGTSWGAGKRPLLTVCRSFVRSVMEYGMEAYFFASPNLLKPLHKI